MKKILLEYANVFAYTFTGLIFGLAFFLLFINFYHMQELAQEIDISEYNINNKMNVQNKIETIKNNISVYDQSTYTGTLNTYGLNTVKIKLQSCLDIIESDSLMQYFELNEINIKDSYNFILDYRNEILNDCLVMQIKSMQNIDTITSLPDFNLISPYIDLNVSSVLISTDYIQNNIENSDHYNFSTDANKNNFFNLVNDSYSSTMNNYINTLDMLVEISNWYRSIVVGG